MSKFCEPIDTELMNSRAADRAPDPAPPTEVNYPIRHELPGGSCIIQYGPNEWVAKGPRGRPFDFASTYEGAVRRLNRGKQKPQEHADALTPKAPPTEGDEKIFARVKRYREWFNEGAHTKTMLAALLGDAETLVARVRELEALTISQGERVAAQSELLGKKAEAT